MWFEYSLNKDKIIKMFGNGLHLNNIELRAIQCCDHSLCELFFKIYDIPDIIPEEWKDKKINSILISLVLTNLSSVNINGSYTRNVIATPEIKKRRGFINLLFKNKEFELFCSGEYFYMRYVFPVTDTYNKKYYWTTNRKAG